MKKPTLRFRQVFEHPTHFKVTRPLGNPIKIAKQGLSPNLMGRLRKFAEGGETLEPTQQDQANLDELMAGSGGDSPRPRPRRSLVDDKVAGKEDVSSDVLPALPEPTIPQSFRSTVMQDAARIEDQAERAQFIKDRINEYRAAASAEPTLVTLQSQPFPEIVRADQVEQTPVAMQGVPVMGPPTPRITQPESLKPVAAEPAAEVAPKTRPRPVRPGVTAEAAEPAAETVAAEAPAAAAEKPAVVEPAKPVEPVKVDPLDEALGALNLTRESLKTMTPLQQSAALSSAQMIMAGKAATEAQMVAADANIQALKEQGDAEKTALKEMEDRAREARDTQRKILEEMEYLKNPGSYFSRLGTLQQIGTAISLAAGAFATGMTGMPNFAQKIFDNAIEEDLAEQKRRSDSLYQRLVAAGHSVEGAEDMVRAQLKLVGAAEQGRKAAMIKLPEAKAKLLEQQAKTVNDAIQTMVRVGKEEQETATKAYELARAPEREAEKRRMEQQDADYKQARLNLDRLDSDRRDKRAADKMAFDKAQADAKLTEEQAERTFNVSGRPIQAKDKTSARTAEDAILGESEFIDLAEKTLDIFKEHPIAANVWNTAAYNTAKLYLGQMLERYPKVERFRRPLNVTASKVVKDAMGSLQGLEAAVFKRPSEVLGAIVEEAKNARRVAIAHYSRPTDEGKKQAEEAIRAVERPAVSTSNVGFSPR